MSEEPIVVHQVSAFIPVSRELLEEAQETRRAMDAWWAMSPEEREAATAKRDAERAAARAAAEVETRRFLAWLAEQIGDGPFVEAHRAIVDEHPLQDGRDANTYEPALVCGTCAQGEDVEGDPYPCRTLRALAKAYGWSG